MNEIGKDGEMRWERIVPPIWWPEAGRHVVADRYLTDGTRQHMVAGTVAVGTVISNAQIVGESDAAEAEFSTQLSHLG